MCIVIITRQPNSYMKAKINIKDIFDIKWDYVSGGIHQQSGYYGLYGKIHIKDIIEDDIAHGIEHDDSIYGRKIYIPKKYNKIEIYNKLAEFAGEKPAPLYPRFDIADKVREQVINNPGITGVEVIKNIQEKYNIPKERIQNSIRYVKKYKSITKTNIRSEKYGRTQKLFPV